MGKRRKSEQGDGSIDGVGAVDDLGGKGKKAKVWQARDEAGGADSFFETADEARVRLAKEFLEQIGAGAQSHEEISERLLKEADVASKKIHYRIADEVELGPTTFYRGHKQPPTCIAAGGDDSQVFTGGKDCAIIRWDVETGEKTVWSGMRRMFDCGGHFEQVLGLCVNRSGNVVCSVGVDRLVRVWDTRALSSARCVAVMKGHTNKITAVCCDPTDTDLSEIYTASADKSIRTWNLSTRREVDSFYGHTRTPLCMDIVSSHTPFTGGEDNTARRWRTDRGTHMMFDKHVSPVDACTAISGQHFASGSQNGEIALWSASHRKPICVIPKAHNGCGISSLACVRHSDTIFSGSDDGFIRLWKTSGAADTSSSSESEETGRMKELQKVPVEGFVNSIVISRSGRHLFAAAGKEHRHGRWVTHKKAKNGIVIIPLSHSAVGD